MVRVCSIVTCSYLFTWGHLSLYYTKNHLDPAPLAVTKLAHFDLTIQGPSVVGKWKVDLLLKGLLVLFCFQVMIQAHNRHMSFSYYVAALAVSDTLSLLIGELTVFSDSRVFLCCNNY